MPAEHVASAVGSLSVGGRPEARLTEAGGLAAGGVLDVDVPRKLVGRAVGGVRVAGLAVNRSPCAAGRGREGRVGDGSSGGKGGEQQEGKSGVRG